MTRSSVGELGAHNPEVKRLRALLRDASARTSEGVFVVEGPRIVEVACATGDVQAVYVGTDASEASRAVADRASARGLDVRTLGPGVATRIADTVHSQGVFGVARMPQRTLATLEGVDFVVVCEHISDPGNAGTLLRSAAGAGAGGVIFGSGSVDAYNPKVVRASAGACFALPIVEDVAVVEILEALGAAGMRRVGAVMQDGHAPETFDFRAPTALVVGHETAGVSPDLPLDARVTIPMAAGESLNVAMAATVLLFEAARQRRAAS
jgi:RNA methyltransferase, TrmH family